MRDDRLKALRPGRCFNPKWLIDGEQQLRLYEMNRVHQAEYEELCTRLAFTPLHLVNQQINGENDISDEEDD